MKPFYGPCDNAILAATGRELGKTIGHLSEAYIDYGFLTRQATARVEMHTLATLHHYWKEIVEACISSFEGNPKSFLKTDYWMDGIMGHPEQIVELIRQFVPEERREEAETRLRAWGGGSGVEVDRPRDQPAG